MLKKNLMIIMLIKSNNSYLHMILNDSFEGDIITSNLLFRPYYFVFSSWETFCSISWIIHPCADFEVSHSS